MDKNKLIFLRNYLFKTFIVGVVFAIFLFVMTTIFWDTWSSFIYSRFLVADKELGELVVKSFLNLRFFLVFVILVPAIGLHWMIKSR